MCMLLMSLLVKWLLYPNAYECAEIFIRAVYNEYLYIEDIPIDKRWGERAAEIIGGHLSEYIGHEYEFASKEVA